MSRKPKTSRKPKKPRKPRKPRTSRKPRKPRTSRKIITPMIIPEAIRVRTPVRTSVKRKQRRSNITTIGLAATGLAAAGLAAWGIKKHYDNKNYFIEVMPDVEGCWNKVLDFMTKSRIFTVNGHTITYDNFKPENYRQINMKSNCKFVCLGDMIDNGPNNFAVLALLRYLKETYGKNVILILGNRDINKLRLKFELETIRPKYIGNTELVNLYKQLVNLYKILGSQNDQLNIKVEILKYLLTNTFGIRDNFNFMKTELNTINDLDVLKGYKDLVSNYNDLMYILKNGQLIYYDEPTKSIFVHGSINCVNFLKNHNGTITYKTVDEWVKNLNKWARDIIINPTQTNIEELILYQEPDHNPHKKVITENQYSVVGARPWDYDKTEINDKGFYKTIGVVSQIIECSQKVNNLGINNILVGHSPIGQLPIIIKDENTNIITVACDTTYASRISNITVNKNEVFVRAFYNPHQTYIPKNICIERNSDYYNQLIPLEYSSKDRLVGINIDMGRVIAKYPANSSDSYLCVNLKNDSPVYSTVELADV